MRTMSLFHRMVFILIFAAIGMLSVGWWHNNARIVSAQNERIERFMSAGARFTAQDGQALCLRIQRMEAASYGYHDQGGAPLPCEFIKP